MTPGSIARNFALGAVGCYMLNLLRLSMVSTRGIGIPEVVILPLLLAISSYIVARIVAEIARAILGLLRRA
jgi:hypothetical protein